MSLLLDLNAIRLRFPKGPINLEDVTTVDVEAPFDLYESMDMVVKDFKGDETPTEIKQKTGPALTLLQQKLAVALTPWSEPVEWTVDPYSVKLLHHPETWALQGVGFVMTRPTPPDKDGLMVEVFCGAKLEAGQLECEVIPWELSQLTIE